MQLRDQLSELPVRMLSHRDQLLLFLYEGRLEDALATWRSIVEWHEQRGVNLAAEYPKRELERLGQTPEQS